MSLWLAPRHNIRFPGCLLSFILWLFLATCDCARIYCDTKTNNAVDHGRKYVFMYFRTVIAHSPLSFWVVFSFLFSMHVRCACIVQQSDDGRSRGRGWQECCWFFFFFSVPHKTFYSTSAQALHVFRLSGFCIYFFFLLCCALKGAAAGAT